MSHSVEDARRGLILLVKYLKKVRGRQVVHEINEILGSEHGIKMLNQGTRDIKLDHLYPLLEFAGIEPHQFDRFISVDSYGHLPLYLFEIESLSPSQIQFLEAHIRRRRSSPTKQALRVSVSELPEKRFHMSAKAVADVCWATISHSEAPKDLYHAWTQLSIVARGQAKYSRAASCSRRALEYAQTPHQRGKLLQTVCYLAQHVFDLYPAREIILRARMEHLEAGDRTAVAQTWMDESQILNLTCKFHQAITAARIAEDLLPNSALRHLASCQQVLGRAAIKLGDLDGAYGAHKKFQRLIRENEQLNNPTYQSHCDYLLAEIYVAEQRFIEASGIFRLLYVDPGKSLHMMDRVLIALNLVSCELALGRMSDALLLAEQTRAFLRSIRPQTPATLHFRALLSSTKGNRLTQGLIVDLLDEIRRPPPPLRRRPAWSSSRRKR